MPQPGDPVTAPLRLPQPNHPLTAIRRVGVVQDIAAKPNSVNVWLGGDTNTLTPCAYLSSYIPAVGDNVLILQNNADYIIVGAVNSLGVQTFTPTWTSTGTAPVVGNGTLQGWFEMVSPSRCNFDTQLVIGSTSTGGTGVYAFGNLPFTSAASRSQVVSLKIITGAVILVGHGTITFSNVSVSQMFYQTNAAGMTQFGNAAPVLGVGNVIQTFGTYEIA